MMTKACILVKAVPVKGKKILEEVGRINGVKKAFLAYGRADIVVLVEAKEYEEILKIVDRIHSVDGVRSTETLTEAW